MNDLTVTLRSLEWWEYDGNWGGIIPKMVSVNSYFQAGEFKCNSARICCVKCAVIKTPQHWLMISLRGFTSQDVGNDYHLWTGNPCSWRNGCWTRSQLRHVWWHPEGKEIPGYPLVNIQKNYGKSPCSMGKSTISMAIFNSYGSHYQRVFNIAKETYLYSLYLIPIPLL